MDVIGRGPLSKHVFDHFAEDVSEAEVTPLMAIGEAFVVDAEVREDGSLQVVDVNGFVCHIVTEFIGLPMDHSRLSSAARRRGPGARGLHARGGGAPWGCGAVQGGAVGGNVVCCGYAAANYRFVKSSNSVPITF